MTYSSVAESRNGYPVPVFPDGHAMHSKYDPAKEASQTAARFCHTRFFLLAGAGGGYLVRSILDMDRSCFILAAEASAEDIEFLQDIPVFASCRSDPRVVIFPVSRTAEMLSRYYIPAVYGSMQIIENPVWMQEDKEAAAEFRRQTTEAQKKISADFSVQAHFGRIWQRSIMMNLRQLKSIVPCPIDTSKTALIAAAGPSLDTTASYIESRRESLYVIATDTAYASFVRRGIRCDAVISIDGQNVSHVHFLEHDPHAADTLYVFDLCADPSAVRTAHRKSGHMLFVNSGHPLACLASSFSESKGGPSFPRLEAGSGTVTIAAADFAVKAGFSDIVIAGADFSYLGGKAYMRGTYLDTMYHSESTREIPAEMLFSRLLFRAPLIPYRDSTECTAAGSISGAGSSRLTTEVLDSYRTSFEQWLRNIPGAAFRRDGMLTSCTVPVQTPAPLFVTSFDCRSFSSFLGHDIGQKNSTFLPGRFSPAAAACIPAAAFFRIQKGNESADFPSLLNLAYSEILRYTERI